LVKTTKVYSDLEVGIVMESITLILWKRMSRKKASSRPSGRCGCGDLHPAPPHSLPHS